MRALKLMACTIILIINFYCAPLVFGDSDKTVADAPLVLDSIVGKTGVSTENIYVIFANIVQAALTLVGLIFLIIMIYGGFVWMTAQGNEDRVEKAKQSIRTAIIGIIVIVSAYGITSFLTTSLLPSGDGAPPPPPPLGNGQYGLCFPSGALPCSGNNDCPNSEICDPDVGLCTRGFNFCESDNDCDESLYGPGARCLQTSH